MRRAILPMVTIVAFAIYAPAQSPQSGERKLLSPPATAEATISGKKIIVHYSAPSMRGRKIMGGLVPWDKVWRTGANAATTLISQADLRIGTLTVPRGAYTIYTVPSERQWTLVINRQTGQWGTQYDQTQDLGRTAMTVKHIDPAVEMFEIEIVPTSGDRGVLKLIWENTEVNVPIELVDP